MIDIPEPEKFADELDRATEITQKIVEGAIEKTLRRIESPPKDFEPPYCNDCQGEIPELRLNTGAFRCIYCQTKYETNLRNHRGFYD